MRPPQRLQNVPHTLTSTDHAKAHSLGLKPEMLVILTPHIQFRRMSTAHGVSMLVAYKREPTDTSDNTTEWYISYFSSVLPSLSIVFGNRSMPKVFLALRK
jgi:hypothetical protein